MNINSVLDDVQASLLILVGVKWYYGYVLEKKGPLSIDIYMESMYVFISPYTYIDRERYLWVKWNDVWDLFLNSPGK